jgi:microcystin-dependent protein
VATPFLGEIRTFAFNFAPQGWALCNGQILSIPQNAALYSLLGTTYGGNGTTTFALPNLQSRVAIHMGQGTGLSQYFEGQVGGTENVTLNSNQMPQHSHPLEGSSSPGSASRPAGAVLARSPDDIYAASPDGTVLNAGAVGTSGGSQPFGILQPYLVLNFCIAIEGGIFPTRN